MAKPLQINGADYKGVTNYTGEEALQSGIILPVDGHDKLARVPDVRYPTNVGDLAGGPGLTVEWAVAEGNRVGDVTSPGFGIGIEAVDQTVSYTINPKVVSSEQSNP